MNQLKKTGKVLLFVGILLLAAGILFAFAIGTIATPILLGASVILNALGVTLLRGGEET